LDGDRLYSVEQRENLATLEEMRTELEAFVLTPLPLFAQIGGYGDGAGKRSRFPVL